MIACRSAYHRSSKLDVRAVELRQRCIHMHELPTAMKSPSSLESASPAGALLTCKTVKSIETRVNSIQNRIKLRAPFLKQQGGVGKKGGGGHACNRCRTTASPEGKWRSVRTAACAGCTSCTVL